MVLAKGKALDSLGRRLGLERDSAMLLGYRLPWLQLDSTYRERQLAKMRGIDARVAKRGPPEWLLRLTGRP